MPNFAVALKQEICRLARREIKAQVTPTRQAIVQYRHEIAHLKQLLREQQRRMDMLEMKKGTAQETGDETDNGQLSGLRFSTRSVKAQRRRLGLSAEDYGKLVGVSGLTIYNWEHGRTRPRAAQFEVLAGIRGITRREAAQRLGLDRLTRKQRKPR
jgi:DNA-binding transcriptional regulator YiaG